MLCLRSLQPLGCCQTTRRFGLTEGVAEAASPSRLPSGTRAIDPAAVAASWTSSYPRSRGHPLTPARARGRHPLPLSLVDFLCTAWLSDGACNAARTRVCPGARPRARGGGCSPLERGARSLSASRSEGRAEDRSDGKKRRLSSIHELLWKMLSALGAQLRIDHNLGESTTLNIERKDPGWGWSCRRVRAAMNTQGFNATKEEKENGHPSSPSDKGEGASNMAIQRWS